MPIDNRNSGTDTDGTPDDGDDVDQKSSLLLIVIDAATQLGGRATTSGEPRRTHHSSGRSLVLPAVAARRAALHGDRLPTGKANSQAAAVLPRPATASLLPSSSRPQPGRADQRGIRTGPARRVAMTRIRNRNFVATTLTPVSSTTDMKEKRKEDEERRPTGAGSPRAGTGDAPTVTACRKPTTHPLPPGAPPPTVAVPRE